MLKKINVRDRVRKMNKAQKLTVSGVAALSVAGIAFTAVPSQATPAQTTQAAAEAPAKLSNKQIKDVKAAVTDQKAADSLKVSRAGERVDLKPVSAKTYGNNVDGWIRQSLDIMKEKGIPGSYHGLHKNIMRESSGNPMAINNWDINAKNGIPSKGLLQVIQPTFDAYHVSGTSKNIYDPVANITAAANYAADRYGSIDNVNSAY
ncbi:transglycosylase SLT domain-containing protein [Streptomyces sp. RY43-2]|uniref:Transglycosylase SLT domain-containing protein n=1 Tax=Streptomyces macrolidinus TaxID=2952607 RepID=A0ABT0ZLY3_9ACTN|nr:transglycosylase SLT domain-containing protein [Streptomyces macrolidinus]MCN9244595.1 transglycosylase SLT domain-containing protein [Streptomyces macrolidinus]